MENRIVSRRRAFASVVASTVVLAASVGEGALLLEDHFDYTAGDLVTVASANWTSSTGGNQVTVVSGNLSYPTLALSTGSQLDLGATGNDPVRSFTNQTSGDIYYSFLLNVVSRGTLSGNSESSSTYLFALFRNGSSSAGSAALTAIPHPSDPNQYRLGVKTGLPVANATAFDADYQQTGETVLVVVRARYSGVAGQDTLSLWVNPATASLGAVSPPTADATTPVTTLHTQGYDRFVINQPTTSSVGLSDSRLDSLRIGTTWADVTPVPEPVSAMLVAPAMLMLGRRRRQ